MSTIQDQVPIARARTDWRKGDRAHAPDEAELHLLADWLDSVFRIPGTNIRFGLDPLLGLLPGFGDTLTSVLSLYILHAAHRRGVPRVTLARMGLNIAIDWMVGAIPFAGDVFDVYWKANRRNVALLQRHAAQPTGERRRASWGDTAFVFGVLGALVLVLIGSITLTVMAFAWLIGLIF